VARAGAGVTQIVRVNDLRWLVMIRVSETGLASLGHGEPGGLDSSLGFCYSISTEILYPIERPRLSGSVQLRCIGHVAAPAHRTIRASQRRPDRYTATG
jgi:hypothetical protein